MVVECLIWSNLYSSLASALQNSLPLSVTISSGVPKRQIHFSKTALPTVFASLLGIAIISAYLVNASVIHKINFFPSADVFNGPNKSMWQRWFIAVHCGSGLSRFRTGFISRRRAWQRGHAETCRTMSASILGQKYDCSKRSFVLFTPS